jgi:transcriptional regulator with XRE-family HTH domain
MTKKPTKASKEIKTIATRRGGGSVWGDPVFAANLRRLLAIRGMSARELAQRIGISAQAVSQWLSHQTAPTNRRLAQIAAVFAVPVMRLQQDTTFDAVAPLRELAMTLAPEPDGQPSLDEDLAKGGLWLLPTAALGLHAEHSDVAVLRVTDSALQPDLRLGDYMFADMTCRTIVTPGIYLLMIAGVPTWRRCHPLIGDKVLVADGTIKQEASARDLVILARAIRLLTEPMR